MLKSFNTGIAFAFALIAITMSSTLIGCNKSTDNAEESAITEGQIKELAATYNYTVSDLQPNTYKVSSLKELKTILQDLKVYNESSHIQSLVEDNKKNVEFNASDSKKQIDKIKELAKLLPAEKKNIKVASTDDEPFTSGGGYKYSKTYYLWGSGTTPNYYFRIDYNTDGNGHFVGAPAFSSGIIGYSLATYTQIGVNFTVYVQNGTLVFEVSGINKVAISAKGFTLSDGTVTTFTGYVDLLQPGGGTSLDYGQFTGGSIWWTLTAPSKAQK